MADDACCGCQKERKCDKIHNGDVETWKPSKITDLKPQFAERAADSIENAIKNENAINGVWTWKKHSSGRP